MIVAAPVNSLPQSASGENAMDFSVSEELFLISPEQVGTSLQLLYKKREKFHKKYVKRI
jgi:hypothetical protein